MSDYDKNKSFVELLGKQIVFIHDPITLPGLERIRTTVKGIDKYDRVIPITRKNDVILLKQKPEKEYLNWLKKVNLGFGKIIVLKGSADTSLPERVIKNKLKNKFSKLFNNEQVVSPYYGGELEKKASDYLGLKIYANLKVVKKLNSKIFFKNLCQQANILTVEGELFNSNEGKEKLYYLVKKVSKYTGKVIVRGEYGASASNTKVIKQLSMRIITEIIDKCEKNESYLIEPYYDIINSPSSLWFIDKNKKIYHLRTSDQILNGTTHEGNSYPCKCEQQINKVAYKLVKEIAKKNFIGALGLDFIKTKKGIIYPIECNPRITGASYPWEILKLIEKKGKIPFAKSQNIKVSNKLKFKDLLKKWKKNMYDGTKTVGIIVPFNVGPISEGKITVLVTGKNEKEVDKILNNIKI